MFLKKIIIFIAPLIDIPMPYVTYSALDKEHRHAGVLHYGLCVFMAVSTHAKARRVSSRKDAQTLT